MPFEIVQVQGPHRLRVVGAVGAKGVNGVDFSAQSQLQSAQLDTTALIWPGGVKPLNVRVKPITVPVLLFTPLALSQLCFSRACFVFDFVVVVILRDVDSTIRWTR